MKNNRNWSQSGWSIYAHHGCANEGDYAKRTDIRGGAAEDHEYKARYAEIPDDTRSLTGRFFGDPLPGRSALAKKQPLFS